MDKDRERLLIAELVSLRDELCAKKGVNCDGSESDMMLGLCRLFPDLDIKAWKEISSGTNLKDWLAFPVNGEAYPHLKLIQQNLEELSYERDHDPLTGLANRRAFERILDLEIERSRRNKTPVSLALIDIDKFKEINDTHGHVVGDAVLTRLSGLIGSIKRRYDVAARFGGDELAIVLPGIGQVRSGKVLSRFMHDLDSVNFNGIKGSEPFKVTCSVGLASYRGSISYSVREFVKLADEALYEAKSQGRNRVALASMPEIDRVFKRTLVHADEKKLLFTAISDGSEDD